MSARMGSIGISIGFFEIPILVVRKIVIAKSDIRITAKYLWKKITNAQQMTTRIPIPVSEFERKSVANIRLENRGGARLLS